jgi:hypothetical protein
VTTLFGGFNKQGFAPGFVVPLPAGALGDPPDKPTGEYP